MRQNTNARHSEQKIRPSSSQPRIQTVNRQYPEEEQKVNEQQPVSLNDT